jgi:hypothetical protein
MYHNTNTRYISDNKLVSYHSPDVFYRRPNFCKTQKALLQRREISPTGRPNYLVHTLQSGRPYCFFAKWPALCLVHSLPSGLIGSLCYAQLLAHLSHAMSWECGSSYSSTNSAADCTTNCKQGRCRLRGVVACTNAVHVSVTCSV